MGNQTSQDSSDSGSSRSGSGSGTRSDSNSDSSGTPWYEKPENQDRWERLQNSYEFLEDQQASCVRRCTQYHTVGTDVRSGGT